MSVLILSVAVTADGAEIVRKPTWKDFMLAYDNEAGRLENIRKEHEVCETDLGLTAEDLQETQWEGRRRLERTKHEKPGAWEGPRARFAILLGGSHPWRGPESARVVFPDGSIRCRGCGHLSKLAPSTYCLHCCRSGLDHIKGIKGTHRKPDDPRPEVKAAGPVTRKARRKKLAG